MVKASSARIAIEMLHSSFHRLTFWLQQIIRETLVEEQKLEEDLAVCRKLLGPWKLKCPENPLEDASDSTRQGSGPSPFELQELEILNKALEKALKVRNTAHGNKLEVQQKKNKDTADDSTVQCATSSRCVPTCHKIVKCTTEPPSREQQKKLVTSKWESSKKQPHPLLNPPYRIDPVAKNVQSVAPVRQLENCTRGTGKSNVVSGASHNARFSVSSNRSVPKPQQRSKKGELTDVTQLTPPDLSVQLISSEGTVGQNEVFCSCGEQHSSDRCCSFHCKQINLMKNGDAVHGSGKSETQSRVFTLHEDGLSLKLPSAYRIDYIKNASLWEKVHLCQKNAASEALHFAERLQSTFQPGLPTLSPMEVEMQIDQISLMYHSLRQGMGKIAVSYAASLPWDKEYESVLTLENYHSFVSHLLQQLHELQTAVDFYSKVCSSVSIRKVSQKCRKHNGFVPGLLLYSTSQELREIAVLKQNIRVLQQKIELQKALAAELLPYFQIGSPRVTDLPVFYRAIYSLLCEGGRHFPVLVIDDIPE